jgi:hypothetical protein
MEVILTAGLLILVAGVGWVVAKVFRGDAPTGESSARADINASGTGFGTEQMDNIRNKQDK